MSKPNKKMLAKLRAQLAAERSWDMGRKTTRIYDEREQRPITLPYVSIQHLDE